MKGWVYSGYISKLNSTGIVEASKLNVREKPWGKILGQFIKNQIVYILDQTTDLYGNLWYLASDAKPEHGIVKFLKENRVALLLIATLGFLWVSFWKTEMPY